MLSAYRQASQLNQHTAYWLCDVSCRTRYKSPHMVPIYEPSVGLLTLFFGALRSLKSKCLSVARSVALHSDDRPGC